MNQALEQATKGLVDQRIEKKRTEVLSAHSPKRTELGEQRTPLQAELDEFVPGDKRVSCVWVYENVSTRAATPARDR